MLFLTAALPALVLAGWEQDGVSANWFLLEAHFALDTPRRILLMLTGLLWALAGLFAGPYLRKEERRGEFSFYFGAAMAGNIGLLVAADAASFYTFFALMTFASYGLVIHTRSETARRAARIYLVMAILGELFLITALYFAILRADSLLLEDLAPALATGSGGLWIFLLGLIGFGVKVGAFPLYFWLPLAHPVAPTPASAVLSGAMIKAGLVGWMHLAPIGLVDWSFLATLMVTLGFLSALGAVLVGLLQVDPKTNLAYSSISQMGLITALLGIGLSGTLPATLLLPACALYAFNHGTAKALLFLGTALPAKVGGSWRRLMWGGLGIGVLSIAGAPLTGGLWTKYLLKNLLGETTLPGRGVFLILLTLSAIGTTLLLARFLFLLSRIKAPPAKTGTPPFLIPWVLLLLVGGWWTLSPILLPPELSDHLTKDQAISALYFSPGTLWASFWPILLGAFILILTIKIHALNRWPSEKPFLPPGDLLNPLVALGGGMARALQKLISFTTFLTSRATSPEETIYRWFEGPRTKRATDGGETFLRRWEIVGLSFLLLFFALLFVLR